MFASRMFRWAILSFLVLLMGMIAVYLVKPKNFEFQAGDVTLFQTDADLQIDRLHVVQNTKGYKEWELWADVAKVYRKEDVTRLENLRIQLYPKNGKGIVVTADRGEMQNKTRNIQVRGNVVVRSDEGYTVQTESLRFNPKKKEFDTDDRITLKNEGFELTGVGLRGRTDVGEFVLKQRVRAVIYSLGKKP